MGPVANDASRRGKRHCRRRAVMLIPLSSTAGELGSHCPARYQIQLDGPYNRNSCFPTASFSRPLAMDALHGLQQRLTTNRSSVEENKPFESGWVPSPALFTAAWASAPTDGRQPGSPFVSRETGKYLALKNPASFLRVRPTKLLHHQVCAILRPPCQRQFHRAGLWLRLCA